MVVGRKIHGLLLIMIYYYFNLLESLDVEPVISTRNNATTRECHLRTEEVLLINKLGYQRWKQIKDVGRRWIAEIVFTSIKNVLGEDLFSSLVHRK